MEGKCENLQRAINEVASLMDTISQSVDRNAITEFSRVCQKFVELRTKLSLIEAIDQNNIPESINSDRLGEVEAKNDEMRQKIIDLQNSLKEIHPERVTELLDHSRQTLESVTRKLEESRGSNIDELLKMVMEELAEADRISKSQEWYDRAYAKLSEFTGIEVAEDGTVRVLGTHIVQFTANSVHIDPPDVFVGDLDPFESSNGVCVSEIIERLAALKDMRNIADTLGYRLETCNDAPLVALFPPSADTPAIFALIGHKQHPLVEWGNVNVDAFNSNEQPMMDKVRKLFSAFR